jgi:hypothetical protein
MVKKIKKTKKTHTHTRQIRNGRLMRQIEYQIESEAVEMVLVILT